LALKIAAAGVRDAAEIEGAIAAMAGSEDGGLLVLPDVFNVANSATTTALAAKYRVPAIYSSRQHLATGGLPMEPISRSSSATARPTSTASCAAQSRPTCRSKGRQSFTWSSTSKPPKRSASPSRKRCWPPPMRVGEARIESGKNLNVQRRCAAIFALATTFAH
jgi:hypothetical protein